MRLLLPPSSIPCGLVRLNCLAWGLTLRLLIRKLCPWCSSFLIATQPYILYACLRACPLYTPPSPLTELPHVWLMQPGFTSNRSPKVRILKPSLFTFNAFSAPSEACTVILRPLCLILVSGGRWEQCDPCLTLRYIQLLSSHRTLHSVRPLSRNVIQCIMSDMEIFVLNNASIWKKLQTTTTTTT